VTALARPPAASDPSAVRAPELAVEHWRRATEIRREWLAWGLNAEPADRSAAEQALTNIYARLARPRPRFVWVDSPRQALAHLAGLPTHDMLQRWVMARRPAGTPPLASDLAAGGSWLRSALEECLPQPDPDARPAKRKRGQPWPELPPLAALRAGVPLREVVRQGVRAALHTSFADGFYLPVRAALGPLPVAWYGQQESWIAYYDAWRRLGLARYPRAHSGHLDDWAALARSCGWWWPDEDRCVVVERPAVISTEPVPGAWHEQVRVTDVTYRDGWRPALRPEVRR
jgi:hypothetical protein